VEFIEYARAVPMLKTIGVEAELDDDLLRLGITPEPDSVGLRRLVLGPRPDDGSAPDDATVRDVPIDRLPSVLEDIAARLHFPEYALIPAGTWKNVLDIAAFELASDEAWLDIDAEAAMHQSGRDPLLIDPNHRHLLVPFAKAIGEHAGGPSERLHVTSLEAPFLLTIHERGSLLITCVGEEHATKILDAV
jgi:hypothetical protein